MTVSRLRNSREAVLFVAITPLLMFFSICLEQVDPLVPGKFAFLVLLGPTLLVALTGKRWQGLATAVFCGLGCVVAGWVGSGRSLNAFTTATMSMPVLLGAALLAIGTLLTLRCDEAEQRIGGLDRAVQCVVAAESLASIAETILDAAASVVPNRAVELYVWEPREHAFVPCGSRNSSRPMSAVPLFGGALIDGTALAPTIEDWKFLDAELDRLQGGEFRLPLMSGDGEVFGLLRFDGDEVSDPEVGHLLQILVHFSGLAIKNVLLFEQLREQARRDGLTGLVNYAAFQEELSRAMRRAAESCSPLALVLMDLDKFKEVNDRYGHTVGSALLQKLSEVWRSVLPPDAVLARYGGDEFACVLPVQNMEEAQAHVDDLKRKLAKATVRADSDELTIISSIGIALYPADATNEDDLFHAADQALYVAKRRGGGAVCTAEDVIQTPRISPDPFDDQPEFEFPLAVI
jgi:diguanylate cyclase (GGDEF)-like protein